MTKKDIDRFFEKVRKTNDCWLWTGPKNRGAYGRIYLNKKERLAHRVSFEIAGGTLVPGLVLDHLCKVTLCVNPAHLEQVTQHEDLMRSDCMGARHKRKTHCKRGHAFDEQNTGTDHGARYCKACKLVQRARYNQKRKEKRARDKAKKYEKQRKEFSKIAIRANAQRIAMSHIAKK